MQKSIWLLNNLTRKPVKKNDYFQQISRKAPFGFALHEIIPDNAAKLCIYCFIEVNKAFEKLTCPGTEAITARTAKQGSTHIDNNTFNWIGTYERVASW
jgi:hypothetical protein